MVKKIGDKKIGRVDPNDITKEIKESGAVHGVSSVKSTDRVKGITDTGLPRKRNATRVMTLAEREELFKLVSEEAKKIFPEGTLPESKREIIEGAVKMALDSVLVEDPEEE